MCRHAGFCCEPLCHPFRYRAFVAQAVLSFFAQSVTVVRPLGSTGITPLPRYYGPLRLPAITARQVMDSLPTLSLAGIMPGLPGSSTNLSIRALPNHPGQFNRFFRSLILCQLQASPSLEGWPLPFSVTRPNRVRFRWARIFVVREGSPLFAPALLTLKPVYSPYTITRIWETATTC